MALKVSILYPHVVTSSDAESKGPAFYAPYQKRFVATYDQFRPGYPHTLRPILCSPSMEDATEAMALYSPTADDSIEFEWYCGGGWDVGAHQSTAIGLDCDLVVCCATPTHFREDNWLLPIAEAFEKYGDGLYGTSASYQNMPHIRGGCFAFSPDAMRRYPNVIDSREKSFYFESGQSPIAIKPDWCFTNWMLAQGKTAKFVTRDGCYDLADWRKPANIFRRGDQSNALAWDRHYDIYAAADPAEKAVLEKLADG